eukprot:Anaeramoba_ignava/a354320_68.p1 GENE.a354320_68~~a354320_68.p1  ORF type:complete len:311 (+),score=87.61 a354320_68:31-963(+)
MKVLLFLIIFAFIQCYTLYGLTGELELVSVDPVTAIQTAIGKIISHEAFGENLATLDPDNNLMYFVGTNLTSLKICLVSVSLQDGHVVDEIVLPYVSESFIGVGELCNIDRSTGDVLVMGRDPAYNYYHNLIRVTPSTKTYKSLAIFNLIDLIGGAYTYDYKNGIQWIQLCINNSGQIDARLIGFDGNTGQMVHNIEDSYFMSVLTFDPVTDLVWGLGLNPPDYESRVLLTLDSSNANISKVADIQDFLIIAPMATINPDDRILYYYMENSTSHDIHMVEISMNDYSILRDPVACHDLANCVWVMEYDKD